MDKPYLHAYLSKALEIEWNKKGTKIEKAKINDKKVDIKKLKQNIRMELLETKQHSEKTELILKTEAPT